MTESIKTEIGFTETNEIVSGVYADKYGRDGFKVKELGVSKVYFAQGAVDKVKVKSQGSETLLITEKTDGGTLGQIEKRIEQAGRGPSDFGESTDTTATDRTRKEPDTSSGEMRSATQTGEAGPNTVREVYSDDYIEFLPPETKNESGYIQPGNPDFDRGHDRCEDCAHYIEGGGCHIVRGQIDPEAYCESFYADVGVFGDMRANPNLVIWGDAFDWSRDDLDQFMEDAREWIMERV